jgi:hypothetical protein
MDETKKSVARKRDVVVILDAYTDKDGVVHPEEAVGTVSKDLDDDDAAQALVNLIPPGGEIVATSDVGPS